MKSYDTEVDLEIKESISYFKKMSEEATFSEKAQCWLNTEL